MWKIALAFVVFAALALFVITKGGDRLDMSGEKHEVHSSQPATPAAATPAAPAATASGEKK